MKIKGYLYKLSALFAIALFTLSACGNTASESPEQVIQNFKEAVKELKSADMSLRVVMNGTDAEDNIDFNIDADIKMDNRDEEVRKGDVNLKMSGLLSAGEKTLDGSLSLKIRTIGEDFYFNLMELEANDPNFESFKPLIEPYKKKWLHLASDVIPEDLKKLQKKDEETLAKEKQLKDLFVSTKLIDINKEFGVETLNGRKVYHYGVRLNKDGVKQYIKKAASINGKEMTDAEIEEAAMFVDSIENMEMWIGTKDYHLYKGTVDLSGENLEQSVKANISLTYTANSYNTDIKIDVPEGAEEFNPISLLMGMQMGVPGMMPGLDEMPTDGEMDIAELEEALNAELEEAVEE